jgi:hypothetical protein
LSFHDTENKIYGERSEIIYDDLRDIQEILSFPDHAFHKVVDKAVLEAGTVSPTTLRTAIIAPTTVYGMCFFLVLSYGEIYMILTIYFRQRKRPLLPTKQTSVRNVEIYS